MITANLDNSINMLIVILLVSSIILIVLLVLYGFCEVYDYVEEKKNHLIEDHKIIFKNKELESKKKIKNRIPAKK
ncbi:MAG: hypothetical protein E7207_04935 [Clostridium butyricum]|nr:hypothetical protein [Clostridium butyricum]